MDSVTDALRQLSVPVLRGIVAALASRRLRLPFVPVHLRGLVPDGHEEDVADALNAVGLGGSEPERLALMLGLLADERARVQEMAESVELVWSGPESPETPSRDTAVVVRELFEDARRSVLVASYVLDGGEKARAIFAPLAVRLDAREALDVRLFVNIERRRGDVRPDAEIVAEYSRRFREDVWPGRVLPVVYHDPRALDPAPGPRACLHAKCVVIDERVALVTSANFTEAAHLRNIEAGVLIREEAFARSLAGQFDALVRSGDLLRCCP